MIMECPYCKFEILTKHPIKNNRVDDRDLDEVCKHMKEFHPRVKGYKLKARITG